MKKYLIKISALFLLTAIFFTASSFCFHGLFGGIFEVKEVKAATVSEEVDTCVSDTVNSNEVKVPLANSSHQNSLLPCCVSDNQTSVASSIIQTSEIIKFIPAIFLTSYEPVKTILISVNYYKPLTSPPELLSLRSTILRI